MVAHGSRKEEANRQVFGLVEKLRNYFQTDMFEAAFMELASPSIDEGIRALVKKGLMSWSRFRFFFSGDALFQGRSPHHRKDAQRRGQGHKFQDARPVGGCIRPFRDWFRRCFMKRRPASSSLSRWRLRRSKTGSMEIIENCLNNEDIPLSRKPVIKRVVHTTGDFDFLRNMVFTIRP